MQTKQPVLDWCRRFRIPDSTASVFARDKRKVSSVRLWNRSPAADVSQSVCIVLQRNKWAKNHDDTKERKRKTLHDMYQCNILKSLVWLNVNTVYCQNNNSNQNKNTIFSWPSFWTCSESSNASNKHNPPMQSGMPLKINRTTSWRSCPMV